MNVNDMKVTQQELSSITCGLSELISRQEALMEKYDPIEKSNGLCLYDKVPVNLDDNKAQARLKDFAWRVTEELGEATAALEDHPELVEHFQEELMDALHFYIELFILSGCTAEDYREFLSLTLEEYVRVNENLNIGQWRELVNSREDLLDLTFTMAEHKTLYNPSKGKATNPTIWVGCWAVGHEMARAMNCLKNKPWKVTHMTTDILRYKEHIYKGLQRLVELLVFSGMNYPRVLEMYILKNKVNQFRQQSKY